MGAARVLTRKKFGKGTLMETMYSDWGADREVSFREIEPNLFLLQAFCLGDWKRIMEDGPWLFRKNQVVIKQLASKVGEVLVTDLAAVPTARGEFFRARLRLCGSGEHAVEDLQFEEWMLADESLWRPGTPCMRVGRNVGNRTGRGGGWSGSRGSRADGRARGGGRVFRKWNPRQPADSGGRKRSSTDGQMEGKVPPPPPQYIPPRDLKKLKKMMGTGEEKLKGEKKSSASNAGSAASEEDRRAQ
ncbi:hypothetical protein BRADI_2g11947v3 [Brachypodium distachyon]|uniref:Uncharacterized protein n=1 Tax=Brachypodium distachyon TaxID=15368 RepID=A0A0Q3FXE8_BRADI|nr:hypothetical protein BRADI_2g11947v3 [Brachypodium distachyon]